MKEMETILNQKQKIDLFSIKSGRRLIGIKIGKN